MLITLMLLVDGKLGRIDGLILLGSLVIIMLWIVRMGLNSRQSDPILAEYEAEIRTDLSLGASLGWLAIGFIVLLASSRLLVWGAVNVAEAIGVSDLIIGLTVVAIGTSLPELAASIVAALKNDHDIAVGNILGSNLFNLLAVLGIPGLLRPGVVPAEVLTRDFPYMIGLTLLFFGFAYGFGGPTRVSRLAGVILLLAFVAYQSIIYYGIVRQS